jgi:O-antigen ligase
MEEGFKQYRTTRPRLMIAVVLLYFLLIIILLASKVALVILLLYLVYFLASTAFKKRNRKMALALIPGVAMVLTIIFTTHNPVKNRFLDLTSGTATLFTQEKFSPDIYFNGLQFRLLTWRFTYEILNEQKAWILGVSAGDSQKHLHQKYVGANMYLGKDLTRQGYIIYNCHNIYLQTALESGMAGLAALLLIIITLVVKLARSERRTALIFFLCMLVFGFTESYLSRQFGIVLFTFFPLLAFSSLHTKRNP